MPQTLAIVPQVLAGPAAAAVFSRLSGFLGVQRPAIFDQLRPMEIACLQRVQVCLSLKFLSYGHTSVGARVYVDAEHGAQKVEDAASPAEGGAMLLIRQTGSRHAKKKKFKTSRCVATWCKCWWLRDHHPAYSDIEICEDRLSQLPDDDFVVGSKSCRETTLTAFPTRVDGEPKGDSDTALPALGRSLHDKRRATATTLSMRLFCHPLGTSTVLGSSRCRRGQAGSVAGGLAWLRARAGTR